MRASFTAAAVSTWRQHCMCILNKRVSVFARLRVLEMHRHVFIGIAISRYVTMVNTVITEQAAHTLL